MVRIIVQILGVLVLLLLTTIVTLRMKNSGADGPSVLFPGGELVSGELHTGADPDWSFTDDVFTIELQLNDPMASRRIFVMESDGKVYVPSGYMKSFLGRIWKDWAFEAEAGNNLGVARIEGVRYERQLIRVKDPAIIEGVAQKMLQKYAPEGAPPDLIEEFRRSIAEDETWIFEMAPRSSES